MQHVTPAFVPNPLGDASAYIASQVFRRTILPQALPAQQTTIVNQLQMLSEEHEETQVFVPQCCPSPSTNTSVQQMLFMLAEDGLPGEDAPVIPGAPGAAGSAGATGATGASGIGIPGADAEPPEDQFIVLRQLVSSSTPLTVVIQAMDGDPGEDAPIIPGAPGTAGAAGSAGRDGIGIPGEDAAGGDEPIVPVAPSVLITMAPTTMQSHLTVPPYSQLLYRQPIVVGSKSIILGPGSSLIGV